MYSLPGWDPCHTISGKGKSHIKGNLYCTNKHKKDRIDYSDVNNLTEMPIFDYDVHNPDLDLMISNFTTGELRLGFQDWKWISRQYKFNATVNAEQVQGIEEVSLDIDYDTIPKTAWAGGRLYFDLSLSTSDYHT
jgi:hypothetical protein